MCVIRVHCALSCVYSLLTLLFWYCACQAHISCKHLINTLLHYVCRVHEEQQDQGVGDMDTEDEEHTSQQSLWVERYAPQRYTDLLSEEVTVFLVVLLHPLQQKRGHVPGIVSYNVDIFLWSVLLFCLLLLQLGGDGTFGCVVAPLVAKKRTCV